MEDEREVELSVAHGHRLSYKFESESTSYVEGWRVYARVGKDEVQPPLSEEFFPTRDEALREGIAWIRLRAVHTHPDGSMRDEVK